MVMNRQQKLTLTANILSRCKAMAPDRAPQPNQATAEAWTDALGDLYEVFPVEIWPEVVTVWAAELVGDRMITPKELRHAAYVTRDRWESVPAKRLVLEQRRESRRVERDQQLESGVFGQVRGYVRREVQGHRSPGDEARASMEVLLGGVGRGV